MAITITLRVVGIQFKTQVKVEKANPTIRDVMEAARGGPRDFNFATAPDGSLFQASALLLEPTESESSGRIYEPGLYSLSDTDVVGRNTVTTWQWYLIRDGKQINQPNFVTEKFNTMSPPLKDGDFIIWRLVVVAAQATIRADVSSYDNKAELTKIGTLDASGASAAAATKPGQTKTAQPGGRTSYRK